MIANAGEIAALTILGMLFVGFSWAVVARAYWRHKGLMK